MTERIQKLAELTLAGKMHPTPTPPDYDRMDLLLPKEEMEVKRLCEYIENQAPVLNEYTSLTGLLCFDHSCIGDAFNVSGHNEARCLIDNFYLKHIDNVSVMEWQHASGTYDEVLGIGIEGLLKKIERSRALHTDARELSFLAGLEKVCYSIIKWAHKCSEAALSLSKSVTNEAYRQNLERLGAALLNVPEHPAKSFYEAVLCINLCYSFNPDSFGTLDRYLQGFYDRDVASGAITREAAGELLEELFLTPQAYSTPGTHFTKGGQSHFCIGGYTPDGEDGFTDLSRLIVESLVDLPTFIPEITFRWTSKTSREDLRFVMDKERNDKNKRIAFTNDDRRIKAITQICGFSYEKAISYTMVGCNELAFPGCISASTSKGNVVRSLETLFHKKSEAIENAKNFDEFYATFEKELYADLDLIYGYDDKYNLCRARDTNYVSSLFFKDCIENARSLTQGGGNEAVSTPMLLGMINLIDGITMVKQFVFDEKAVSMREMIAALQADWEGYSDLYTLIQKKGDFFGNDLERSNEVAQKIYYSIYRYLKGKKTVFGYPILMGDHTGYNPHFAWFGKRTAATPDGRHKGDPLKFGIFQRKHDKNGLTALLNSIAHADPYAISCGSTVSNITVEESMVRDVEKFESLVLSMETYFKNGGNHFQLNYVSQKDLLAAKRTPEEYSNLRVRVTGFSEFFVKLDEPIQDDVIARHAQVK